MSEYLYRVEYKSKDPLADWKIAYEGSDYINASGAYLSPLYNGMHIRMMRTELHWEQML